jgi:hypothetical protein
LKPVELSAEAVEDSWEAAQWYEDRQAGLGIDFLDEVEALLPLSASDPARSRACETRIIRSESGEHSCPGFRTGSSSSSYPSTFACSRWRT